MPAAATRHCPHCRTVIPPGFPADLCPKCMLDSALTQSAAVRGGDPATGSSAGGATSASTPAGPAVLPDVATVQQLFPDLEVLEPLGAGGMGAVFKVRQTHLDRLVALKFLVCRPGRELDFALRFKREAQMLARLRHRHIVVLHDFGDLDPERTGGEPLFYFLMEYVDGPRLQDLIRSRSLSPLRALTIVDQMCEALQYAHDQGIVHRDIKPSNILLGENGTAKLADFGLAKISGTTAESLLGGLTHTGAAMGTPHYMAPEQWDRPDEVDHRADIYALGVLLYEMLTRERPAGVFTAPSAKVPSLPRGLDAVVMRALDQKPENRYQTAAQFREDLRRHLAILQQTHAADEGRSRRPRGAAAQALAAVLVLLLAAGTLYHLGKQAKHAPRPEPPATVVTPPSPSWLRHEFGPGTSLAAGHARNGAVKHSAPLLLELWDNWKHESGEPVSNAALRAVVSEGRPVQKLTLTFRDSREGPGRRCYARLDDSGVVIGVREGMRDLWSTSLPFTEGLSPAKVTAFQAALIDDQLSVWLNDTFLGTAHGLPSLPPGTAGLTAKQATLDMVEVLELDGFSRTSALRYLGLEKPPPPQPPAQPLYGSLQGTGQHAGGTPVDLSRAAGVDDFVQVILTTGDWVARRQGGQVLDATEGWLPDITAARLLSMRFTTSAYGIIDTQGQLIIRRGASAGVKAVPPEVQRIGVVDAAWGDGYAIALLKDGTARVWGECYTTHYKSNPVWPQPPPAALNRVIKVAATHLRCASLTAGGRVHLWSGASGGAGDKALAGLDLELVDIQSTWDPGRGLDQNGRVLALGLDGGAQPEVIARDVAAIHGRLVLPKGATTWQWMDNRYGETQDKVNAMLLQYSSASRDAFDVRVTGTASLPHIAVIRIQPATK